MREEAIRNQDVEKVPLAGDNEQKVEKHCSPLKSTEHIVGTASSLQPVCLQQAWTAFVCV